MSEGPVFRRALVGGSVDCLSLRTSYIRSLRVFA